MTSLNVGQPSAPIQIPLPEAFAPVLGPPSAVKGVTSFGGSVPNRPKKGRAGTSVSYKLALRCMGVYQLHGGPF
jgi:hypothetical protein